LDGAEQILVAGPSMLVIEFGSFSRSRLRNEAIAKGFRRDDFRSAEVWLAPDHSQSVAFVSNQLLVIGSPAEIKDALENRPPSPLLARAARYAAEDLWVVSSSLPDPLASLFIPIETQATAFEGSVSVWDGLHLVAAIQRDTSSSATELAQNLKLIFDLRPALEQGTEIRTRGRSVLIRMDLDEQQLVASLRSPAPIATAVAPPVSPPLPESRLKPLGAIKILGLSTGTREIPLGR
jgi:hypothetical protein